MWLKNISIKLVWTSFKIVYVKFVFLAKTKAGAVICLISYTVGAHATYMYMYISACTVQYLQTSYLNFNSKI